MPWVRNRETGLQHYVRKDHWSLTSEEYEVVEGFKKGGQPQAAPNPPETSNATSESSGSSSTRTKPATKPSGARSRTSKRSASRRK